MRFSILNVYIIAQKMNALWNICLDCNEEMAAHAETSALVCQSCVMTKGLFGIAFDEAQLFIQEGYNGQPTLTTRSDTHLHKTLKKYKILDDVNKSYWLGEKYVTRRGIICWHTVSINTGASTASRSTMSVFCMISFKLFLLKTRRERKKSLSVFPPIFQKLQNPAAARKKGMISGGRKASGGEAFVVFFSNFAGISMQWSLIKSSTIFSLSRKAFSLKGSPLR